MKKTTLMLSLALVLLSAASSAAQSTWWTPESPAIGQSVTIFYNPTLGTLPVDPAEVWLHWGVLDAQGDWSPAPGSAWPAGSQLSGDNAAVQSPMSEDGSGVWSLTINPTVEMETLEFVFTDMADNWDNNGGNNWTLSFISAQTVAWWTPTDPAPGDLVTVYYNAEAGSLPTSASDVKLHWGINGSGSTWEQPPSSMWPAGSTPHSDGLAVQSPMSNSSGTIWQLAIQTDAQTWRLPFVVTDGSNWDNNDGSDWEILLADPPPPVTSWHRFVYDVRGVDAGYTPEQVASVQILGSPWGWGSRTMVELAERPGVWVWEGDVGVGTHEYKFLVNGQHYMLDPDNPRTSEGQFTNSVVDVELRTAPYVLHANLHDGMVIPANADLPIHIDFHYADTTSGSIDDFELTLNGTVMTGFSWSPAEPHPIIEGTLFGLGTGRYEIGVRIFDGDSSSYRSWWVEARDPATGFYAFDGPGDDRGDGDYSYPGTGNSWADLLSLELTQAGGGDSLSVALELAQIELESRVQIEFSRDIAGLARYDAELFAHELASRGGPATVRLVLADPASPQYDGVWHNTLLPDDGGATTPLNISIERPADAPDRFVFRLAVADLEQSLGSWNQPWMVSVAGFAEEGTSSNGRSFEVGSAEGGHSASFDPDVYDLLGVETRPLQDRLLANHSANRFATVDAVGRGYLSVHPDSVGPDIAPAGPVLSLLTRPGRTLRDSLTIVGSGELDEGTPVTLLQSGPDGFSQYSSSFSSGEMRFEDVLLQGGVNNFQLEATVAGETGLSGVVAIERWVDPAPVVSSMSGSVTDGQVEITVSAHDNQGGGVSGYAWTADPANPELVSFSGDGSASISFAAPATPGDYFFNIELTDPENVPSQARAMVVVDEQGNADFIDPISDTAPWVSDAIVYEVYPRSYSSSSQLSAITADMQRIADLGVNTLWLMPINPGPSGHGYEINDYYGIEQDYGTEQDFRDLVDAAHAQGLRVVMDLVINHTAISHPFFIEGQLHGENSLFYDYYDRNEDGSHQYYYDWYSLPNLNYDNPDVWREFLDVSRYWVEEFGVDGFRCDVAWGVMERNGQFWRQWRRELKLIKPEVFLLAEAGSGLILNQRFDMIYDWGLHHEGSGSITSMADGTINVASTHSLVTSNPAIFNTGKEPFRFLENHDEARITAIADSAQAKMMASLLFTIPGVPMIYAGQELGETSARGLIDWNGGNEGLTDLYRRLVQARSLLPALRSDELLRIPNNNSSTVYSYARSAPGEATVIAVLNFDDRQKELTVDLDLAELGIDPAGDYVLSNLLLRSSENITGSEIDELSWWIPPYGHILLAVGDEPILLEAGQQPVQPLRYQLGQNYPNPFNPSTRIAFTLPEPGPVRIDIYNLLGRRVRTLLDETRVAGRHVLQFDGRSSAGNPLASGLYIYRMEAGNWQAQRKMLLIK